MKSKDDAIQIIETVIQGKEGNPWIIADRVSLAPQVVPVKFTSKDYAQHAGRK